MLNEFKDFLDLNYNSKNTIDSYYLQIRKLLKFTNNNFTQESLNQYLKEIKPIVSDATYNMVLMCVKVFQKFTKTNYDLPKAQTLTEKLINYIDEVQLKDIIKNTSLLFKDYDKVDMILKFMFYTGVRRGEVINLEKSDINWEKEYILLKNTKGNSDRIIPFHFLKPITLDKFKHFINTFTTSNFIFDTTKEQMTIYFERIKRELSIKDFHPHTMRASCLRYWRENGFDIEELQFLLGHQELKTTQGYAKTNAKSLLDKCKKLKEQKG